MTKSLCMASPVRRRTGSRTWLFSIFTHASMASRSSFTLDSIECSQYCGGIQVELNRVPLLRAELCKYLFQWSGADATKPYPQLDCLIRLDSTQFFQLLDLTIDLAMAGSSGWEASSDGHRDDEAMLSPQTIVDILVSTMIDDLQVSILANPACMVAQCFHRTHSSLLTAPVRELLTPRPPLPRYKRVNSSFSSVTST